MNTTVNLAPIYSSLAADPDFGELVEMFLADVPERIDTIETSLSAGDHETLRRIAHQLKGAAGSYGFEEVTPVAATLEKAIDTGEPQDTITQAADELVAICHRLSPGTPE